MPCGSEGFPSPYKTDMEAMRTRLEDERQTREAITRLLCDACFTLESGSPMSAELQAWWDKHKKADAAQRERERQALQAEKDAAARKAHLEAVRTRVLNQLTDVEREALGLGS